MKIAHVCLSCFFIDGWGYQENKLVREHVQMGHEVLVLASTDTQLPNGSLVQKEPGEYVGEEGARVLRLPYVPWLPLSVARKLRIHSGVKQLLEDFSPEVILFHGLCGWEIQSCAAYVREHPEVPLFADSHEDWNNSARSFVSREFLHKRYYGPSLRRALPQIEKVLCISLETMDFVEEVYRVDRSQLEFYPLGGNPHPDETYQSLRKGMREEWGVGDDKLVLVQSGSFTPRKKLVATLEAFVSTPGDHLALYLIGQLSEAIEEKARALIEKDERIHYLGWQSAEYLDRALCGADVYLQPGTQSVTMQNSLCCRCAVVLDDVKSHGPYVEGNGWLLNQGSPIGQVLREVAESQDKIPGMQTRSYEIATEILDYRKLAQRILPESEKAKA